MSDLWNPDHEMHQQGESQVSIYLYNKQQAVPYSLADGEQLTKVAVSAIPPALAVMRAAGVLAVLEEIEITLVDDPTIAKVHAEFLDDPTPTDVVTFEHGELVISAETAQRQAAAYGQELLRETALYIVHGILHLAGYEDYTEAEAEEMSAIQEKILADVW